MSYNQQGVGGYQSQHDEMLSDREIDARALIRCSTRLEQAIDGNGADMAAYADAVRNNQRLWTMFQVAVCDPENQLPGDLKGILLNLSRYIDRVSFRAVSSYQPELLESLINVNCILAKGLLKNPEAEVTQGQSAPQAYAPAPAEAPPVITSVMTSA